MNRRERVWCLAYAALLAFVTSLPYLIAYAMQGQAWRFTGFVFAVEDGNSYIAKMLLGSQGAWLFRTPYTAEPQRGVLAFLPYLLLGKLAAGPALHEQLVALFHLFRVGAIPLEILAIYRFLGLVVPSVTWKRWGTVLASAGGGLGWVLLALGRPDWLGSLPLDFHSPETFGFLAAYGLPHLVLGRALLLYGLILYLESGEHPRRAWGAGAAFLGLALLQPLTVVSALAVVGAHLVALAGAAWRRGEWRPWLGWVRRAAISAVVPAPFLVYTAVAFGSDPYLRAWTSQNLILSPNPLHYIVAYALVLVPAIAGIVLLSHNQTPNGLLPVVWVLALPALAYWPSNLQRRMPDGVWVAWAALAAYGMAAWAQAQPRSRWAGVALLGLSLPSTGLLLAGGFGVALVPASPAFRPAPETSAFEWLATQAKGSPVVLAAYSTANALPAWAPVRVVAGHGPESADLATLLPQVEAFFGTAEDEASRREFLARQGVRYVFYGPQERAEGGWNPTAAPYLSLRYTDEGYAVFEVLPASEATERAPTHASGVHRASICWVDRLDACGDPVITEGGP